MKFEDLQDRIIELGGQKVLLDADVAQIYGVETRDINKSVTNNPDKFPADYVVELSKEEKNKLVENFHRFNKLKHSTVNPKGFPRKGLVHAGYNSEKSSSSSGHPGNYRNIFQNAKIISQYEGPFKRKG